MSNDPIQDLRTALVRTATRRLRPWWRRRPTILAVLGVLVVAAPATAAIDGLWRPAVAPMAPMKTVTATAAAPTAVCDDDLIPHGGTRTTTATPPAAMLDGFGVLRTPQTTADRGGPDRDGRDGLRPAMTIAPGRIAVDSVRRLGVDAGGRPQWIVPSLIVVPARAATADCPRRPAGRHWMLTVGGGVGDYQDALTSGRLGASGVVGNDAIAIVSGLVPDGVARVTVAYPGDTGAPRTWPVKRNFFSYRVDLPVEQAYVADVTWKDADGQVIPHPERQRP